MTDQELADKVIAVKVGYQGTYPLSKDGVGFYHEPDEGQGMCAEYFVRDWRVAGRMMEKTLSVEFITVSRTGEFSAVARASKTADAVDESLPRAIIEACVEALND